AASFLGYRMIAVVSDVVNTPSGGLTNAENEALTAKAAAVAAFINGGGGLVGFSSVELTTPYGYLGSLGTFSFGAPPQQTNITPTTEGLSVGVTNALDGCCWHDSYLTFPGFLDVLAVYPGVTGAPAAAIGGQQVIVATNCPYSQGFWKTHGMNSCQYGNNANFWPATAFPMMLGSNPYTATQACNILHTPPQGGNALVALAHQLIAAKLNIANGSAAPVPVPATIVDADALIAAMDVETAMVRSNTALGQQMNALTDILDMFNNNMIQPVCVPSGASPKRGVTRPDEFMARDISIEGNYPNPVSEMTSISYEVRSDGHAVLAVYNTLGSRIRVLVDRQLTAGSYDAQWDGRDFNGTELPSGQYFIRLMMDGQVTSAPLTIAR
ncbi:MAG: T9SS type A sorting domain-containing protein, partial [Bacteroidota bacterium]|nr:T9SS type A sorting domain-containing protein [Bacteroidota bacterium]